MLFNHIQRSDIVLVNQQPDQLDLFSPDLFLLNSFEHHVVDPHTHAPTHLVRPPAFDNVAIIGKTTSITTTITITITTIPTPTLTFVVYQEPYLTGTGLSRCVFFRF